MHANTMQTCEPGWLKHAVVVLGFLLYLKLWVPLVLYYLLCILYQGKAEGI